MPLPTSMPHWTKNSGYGIVLSLYPSTDRTAQLELWRSTQATTASSLWVKFTVLPATGHIIQYVDTLPFSTRTYRYKLRSVGADANASSFTNVVSAKPAQLPITLPTLLPTRNRTGNFEIPGSNVWLSSSRTIKVGAEQTTGAITKFQLLPHTALVPSNSTRSYQMNAGHLRPGAANTLTSMYGFMVFPPGARITAFAARRYLENTTDTCNVTLHASQGDITQILSTAVGGSTNWQTVTGNTSNFPHTVTTGFSYVVQVILRGVAASSHARLAYVRATYGMPSYDRSV